MSPSSEEMMSWLLEDLRLSGIKGLSILNLFSGVDARLSSASQHLNESAKDNLWIALVARQDVYIADEGDALPKASTYENVLSLGAGETRVKIRTPNLSPALNGNLIGPVQSVLVTELVPPLDTAIVPPTENDILIEVAPKNLDNTAEVDPRPKSATLPHAASTIPSRKRKTAARTSPKLVERKTERRWIDKSHHTTQEELERQEDAQQYAAGISRVYIDPPGSSGSAPSGRGRPRKQMIAVFKSLRLTDPQWFASRRGTWEPAYHERKAELEKIQLVVDSQTVTMPSDTLAKKTRARKTSEINLKNGERPAKRQKHPPEFKDTSITTEVPTSALSMPFPPPLIRQRLEAGQNGMSEFTRPPQLGEARSERYGFGPVLPQVFHYQQQAPYRSDAPPRPSYNAQTSTNTLPHQSSRPHYDISRNFPQSQGLQNAHTGSISIPAIIHPPAVFHPIVPLSQTRSRFDYLLKAVQPATKVYQSPYSIPGNSVNNTTPAPNLPQIQSDSVTKQPAVPKPARSSTPLEVDLRRTKPASEVTELEIPKLVKKRGRSRKVVKGTEANVASTPATLDLDANSRPSTENHNEPANAVMKNTEKPAPRNSSQGESNSTLAVSEVASSRSRPDLGSIPYLREAAHISRPNVELGAQNVGPSYNTITTDTIELSSTYGVPQLPHDSGHTFGPSLAPEISILQPTCLSPSPSRPPVSTDDCQPYSSRDDIRSQYAPSGQIKSPHICHVQKIPLPHQNYFSGGQPNFAQDAPFFTNRIQGPYRAVPAWHQSFQECQQPQPLIPLLGHSSSSSRHGHPVPVPSEQVKSIFEPKIIATPTASPLYTTQPTQFLALDKDVPATIASKAEKLIALEAMEANMERFSADAEAIELPDITARLFVSYENAVGNLILSGDKTRLSFRAVDQESRTDLSLSLKVAQIKQHPVVSIKGSRPMELQLKYEDEAEQEVICRFYIGQTEKAREAANVMRAAIVTARIVCRAAAGETDTYELFKENSIPNIEIVKPFICETCDKRFKNKEGIKYHTEKSNTTCNPNFVPPTEPKSKRSRRKSKRGSVEPSSQRAKKVKSIKRKDQDDALLQSVELDDCSDDDTSSDDSILLWAEKVAFVNPGETARFLPSTPKKPKAKVQKLAVEEDILQDLAREITMSAPADETLDTTVEVLLQNLVDEVVNFTVLYNRLPNISTGEETVGDNSSEKINVQRSKDIILSLVVDNFGIFPGDKGLWLAFVNLWFQKHAWSGYLPTSKLCDNALDELVKEKKLVVTILYVCENGSMAPTRTTVMLPKIDPNSPVVDKLKELIRMAYPRHYVPSTFAPPTASFEKLQNFIDASSSRSSLPSAVKSTPKRQFSSKVVTTSHDELPGDSDYEDDEDDDFYQSEDAEDSEIPDGDSDDSYYEYESGRLKYADPALRHRQGLRTKSHWAASKASGSNLLTKAGDYTPIDPDPISGIYSKSQSPEEFEREAMSRFPFRSRSSRTKARQHAWKHIPLTAWEKQRRKIVKFNELLNFAPSRLQNPETSAWDQSPLHVKRIRTKIFKDRLPEVVTYLQSEDSTWFSRAYGHGSTPIFARPARRADGNPSLAGYLKRIERAHRPISWPTTNRRFLPALPSKLLLRTGKQPERKSSRKSGVSNALASLEDEDVEPMMKRVIKKRKPTSQSDDEEIQFTPICTRTASPELQPPSLQDCINPESPISTKSHSNANLRVARKTTRGGQELDEVQVLDFFKPRTFPDLEKSPNPGLVSLPTNFWQATVSGLPFASSDNRVTPNHTNGRVHNALPGLEGFVKVAAWEQGPGQEVLASGAKVGGAAWINHIVEAMESSFDTQTVDLKWLDSAAFGIETLPYEDLDAEEVESVPLRAQAMSHRPQPPKKRQRVGRKQRVYCTRRLTAWPTDFDGVVENIDLIRGDLNVQIAPKVIPYYSRALDRAMTSQEETRLLFAVIAVMTLTGGLSETVDWVLVATAFPKYALNHLTKTWVQLVKNQKARIETLTLNFQEAFLTAYKTGDLPTIDYEDLAGYDWATVVDWAVRNLHVKVSSPVVDIQLPKFRQELRRTWNLKEQDSGIDKTRETYFNPFGANYRRMESISAIPHTLPAHILPQPNTSEDIIIDEVMLARSWIKALVFTPVDEYDIEVASERMNELGEELVIEAKQTLLDDKIVMHQNRGRAAPGRNLIPTDAFFSALRKNVEEKQFVEAVKFKKFLDEEFMSGKICVRCDYMANEGTVMCITNLQAYGRIAAKGVNVPMNKFGLTGGGYETRKAPKDVYRFNVDIYPTSTYLFDEEIPELLEYVEPPRGGDTGEIPVWYGITDNLIPELWKEILVAVAGTVALRAGGNVSSLERTFRPALEEWEIWRLMEWSVDVSLMKRLDESHEGWTTAEWWWAIVGRFCDDE